jgi:curved DNA-binding protein CbpA
MVDKIENLQKEHEELNNKYKKKEFQYLETCNKHEKKIEQLAAINEEYEIMAELLKKENADLKNRIKELEKQLAESMTDKFRVKKVRETKPKKQTMKVKGSSVQSKAIKLVKEQM